jgi:dolichyl-phosphate-mannose--protein O-mannosyl transferase
MVYNPTMATARRQRFVRATIAWMLGAALVLSLLSSLNYELFFVVSLIGLLVVVELTAPFSVTPEWRSRLKWLIALGLAVFGYIVIQRILEILPQGVF